MCIRDSTNLGRAPLATTALARLTDVARGYATLEYDVSAGARGSRSVHAEGLLVALTGAEAAVVVNNNAAAMLLVLGALARGREVLISRGELVEIGGGFRVPDVMAQSGALLREVGTTNRTRLSDFTAAMGPQTALVLRVHPSNFRIEGFTEQPALAAVVAAAHEAGVAVVEDLGSGNLDPASPWEPTVQASLAAGVDNCITPTFGSISLPPWAYSHSSKTALLVSAPKHSVPLDRSVALAHAMPNCSQSVGTTSKLIALSQSRLNNITRATPPNGMPMVAPSAPAIRPAAKTNGNRSLRSASFQPIVGLLFVIKGSSAARMPRR